MLMLDTGATTALTRAALGGCHARSARPTASGISMSTMSDRAMLTGSTDTPSTSNGRTIGMYPTVITMRTTIMPTANGMLPFARSASLRRKGAPAAMPHSSNPTPSGSSRPSTLASPMRGKRRQHEIRQQGQHDQPDVSQWRKNLAEGEPQSNGQCARDDEHHDRDIRAAHQHSVNCMVRTACLLRCLRLIRIASRRHRRPESEGRGSPEERNTRRRSPS